MYKKQLTDDFRKIFGIKKILFASVRDGWEQGALYVDVSDTKQVVNYNKQYFRVRGSLGLWGTHGPYKTGFFKNKLWEASKNKKLKEIVNRIFLFDREDNVKYPDMESYFNQTEISFIYRVTLEYDPEKKTKGFKITSYISNLLKGLKNG